MIEAEGVIQYALTFEPGPLPDSFDPAPLFDWFAQCRRHQLIGQDRCRYQGFAYGNISLRCARGFVISGTQTGGRDVLTRQDLAWVQDFDSSTNRLSATGGTKPSSEAMTHGEVYDALPAVNAVIHVHEPRLWLAAVSLDIPVTDPAAGYGTPAMADAVRRLLAGHPDGGIIAMGGHEDGIIAYGKDMPDAGGLLMQAFSQVENPGEDR